MSERSMFIELLVSWGPMLLLIAVWIFFMQRMRSSSWSPYKINEQILEEQKKHNEKLEAILMKMDQRIATLEQNQSNKAS